MTQWALKLDVSRDVRDVRGCLRGQNRSRFEVYVREAATGISSATAAMIWAIVLGF